MPAFLTFAALAVFCGTEAEADKVAMVSMVLATGSVTVVVRLTA